VISMYSFVWIFRGQPGKTVSSQVPPLDESREKRLQLPSSKERSGDEVGRGSRTT
jgi:hypothetical protein